ncbi:MAG: glutamate synthase domain 2 [Haloquadratum sp. J07HQX50]|jgi:Glutamate synthase domain 2|nr:MAG: glutamate synthase domain 2 [Haloquadratum sp. J07HQX50]
MTNSRGHNESASTGLADPEDSRSNCGVGGVVDLDGGASHETVTEGLRLLKNLEHRGTTGAEEDTGDGAGLVIQRPDEFFEAVTDVSLPDEYAVGSIFMPRDEAAREGLMSIFERVLSTYDLEVLEWRSVPTDNSDLGATAVESEPDVYQAFVAPTESIEDDDEFDRTLYIARRAAEKEISTLDSTGAARFYICSLSRQTVVYKGLLKGEQLADYYIELNDERVKSTLTLVHARFSTNTLGAWHLAHPYRHIVHNGEINTIQGNINWMRSRETDLSHPAFGDDLETIKPVINDPDQSDTASVDNAVELLLQSDRELPHVLRMLIPEAYRGDDQMDSQRQAWYDYHASLVEPWDGPALVAATDGDRIAAVLDRNGLRPCRYDITTDNTLIMASEVGALDPDPSEIRERGRLKPGQLFVADPAEGRVIPDDEVFDSLTDEKYTEWVEDEQHHLEEVCQSDSCAPQNDIEHLRAAQAAFGYTHDQINHLIEPMAEDGKDPVGSMGDDTPLSVLSDFNRPLFTYFKQLFAQVTNPPLDYIREELVTSLESRVGAQQNLLDETAEHARQLVLDSPVLTDPQLRSIRELGSTESDFMSSAVVDITYSPETPMEEAIERVRSEARDAINEGAEVIVLSDQHVGHERIPIPSLLVTGAVHHDLVRSGLRNQAGLVIESADPRAVHHIATLVGYGADAVNPYLAYQTIADVVAGPDGANEEEAIAAYKKALEDGLLKTMAKMGISTVESYQGAQIFEAVGLDSSFVAEYFEGTEIRTEGIGIDVIEEDARTRHAVGYGSDPELERQGEYEHRSDGMHHQWNPETVGTLQQAVRAGDYEKYKEFASLINDQSEELQTLRGLLSFSDGRESIPVEEVEPVEEIVTRFSTAAMSLGSLSPEAHENNSIAMNRLGAKSNTGEGGEPPERFGTEKECKVKQVASGRFGVTSEYLTNAEEIQIKMAQGAKPGEGGHLPGRKVNEMIAHVRFSTPGVGLISPPPLHDIYSIEDLKQLIHDLKTANPEADINVKLVSEAGIGTIAAGVSKANADVVHIAGHSGGTGASPKTSIKNAGLPWELGLAEANQMLRATNLRSRIRVSVDGGMKTGRDVAVAALLGGEEYVFGTASLVTSGCVMARQCQSNTCPVGVATQREKLRNRFPGQPEHVINYMTFIAQELREIMASLGFKTLDEMIGRPSLLEQHETDHEKARHLDLSDVIAEPAGGARYRTEGQSHHDIDTHLDHELIERAEPALQSGEPVALTREISNIHRSVGAMLSNRISKAHGNAGLPDNTIRCSFNGIAGQSFGAFLAHGVTMHLTGAANDYAGKGLSGGRLVIETPDTAAYEPSENVLIGNVALYGATQGEMYVNGIAGERFAVRNSGAKAVVEGIGDHGCEYMTGGVVVVLGETGRNFAAGMSGGIAYVYDPDDTFTEDVNREMVGVEHELSDKDLPMIRRLVKNHAAYTESSRADELLEEWSDVVSDFVKIMPDAYAEVIEERARDDVRNELPPAAGVSATIDDSDAVAQTSDD